ncbi:MAG: tetratricopeptide repeat protein [Bryobacterales bacterium]|nr:tetratricopeptide repeat protein [Bryobacterales bacterium]
MIPLILLLVGLAPAQTPSPGKSDYERANALFQQQQFQSSLDAVEEALRLDPKLLPALTLRAKLAMAAKRYDLARADLERAVSLHPDAAYAQFLLGLVLYEQNELQLALAPLEAAMKRNPKDPRAPLYLGLCVESLGDTARAASLYDRTMQLEEAARQPQVETYLIAARLQMVLDQNEQAARVLQKAMRLNNRHRDVNFEWARLEARQGDYPGAVEAATRALTLPTAETTDAQIHALLARSYQALGKGEKAKQHAAAAKAEH